MIRASRHVLLLASMAVVLCALAFAQQDAGPEGKYWQQVESETLWRVRYVNCEYGFAVALPPGVIAHAAKPPSPNHGFFISLYEPGRVTPVSSDSDRLLWVDADSNATGQNSLKDVVKYEIDLLKQDQRKFTVLEKQNTMLGGVAAVAFVVQYKTPEGNALEERVIALRDGNVFTLAMRSSEGDQPTDGPLFQKLRTGFTFLPATQGECGKQ
jgi:hypothetical protein